MKFELVLAQIILRIVRRRKGKSKKMTAKEAHAKFLSEIRDPKSQAVLEILADVTLEHVGEHNTGFVFSECLGFAAKVLQALQRKN